MKPHPQVSVIIPCYNARDYLDDTLNAILEQTFTNFEVIAVNDGSTDNTLDILNQYKDRISILDDENSGVSAARNKGAAQAKGEYLAFCDSDDIWHPEKLEQHMVLGDHDFSFTAIELFGDGMELNFEYIPPTDDDINGMDGLFKVNYITTSTVVIKKCIFEEFKGFDPRYNLLEDWHLWLKIKNRYDFEFIDTPLCRYRVHSDGASKDFNQCAESGRQILTDLYDNHLIVSLQNQQRYLGYIYLTYAEQAYYSGNYKAARSLYWRVFWYLKRFDPTIIKNYIVSFFNPSLIQKLKNLKS